MTTKSCLASLGAVALPLLGGLAGRGLVFIGFAALMMGLYGTVKRLPPRPHHTKKA